MKDVMGIINLAESEDQISELTPLRSLAAVPFGGRYRLVDFALSNMVNAGIRNVGILAKHKYRSLVDHVGSGKEWDLDRSRDGLFMLPPAYTSTASLVYKGDVENFFANLDYIEYSRQKYVVISGSSMVCNIDYEKVLEHHFRQKADITMVYKNLDVTLNGVPLVLIEVGDNHKVIDVEVNPNRSSSNQVFMGMYVMEKRLLMDLVDGCDSRGGVDFIKDGIIRNLGRLNISGYAFDGYLGKVDSLASYYTHSMDLLNASVWKELFNRFGPIYTKVKHEPPAKYCRGSQVRSSLVANGCVIEGTVKNSILFRGVRVAKGAVVSNSILMQKAHIDENVSLRYVILDKDVKIGKGKILTGDPSYPTVIRKSVVI